MPNFRFWILLLLVLLAVLPGLRVVNIGLSAPPLELTVVSTQPTYYFQMDTIQLEGNLTLNGVPVSDAFVAVEVRNPLFTPIVTRTLALGAGSGAALPLNITQLYLCDQNGTPVGSTETGNLSHFHVTVENVGNVSVSFKVAVTLFRDLDPFYTTYINVSDLMGGTSVSYIESFVAPAWVGNGIATIYASVFSNVPRLGGYPYAPEQQATFEIVGAPPSYPPGPALPTNGSTGNGTYHLAFRLLINAADHGFIQGDYTVNVGVRHASLNATNQTTFVATLAGDIDGDDDVDSTDVFSYIALAYGSKGPPQRNPVDPHYNPLCDFDEDGDVDSTDVFSYLALNYGNTLEIREYRGQDLSSRNDFMENSISGPQYINETNYRLVVTGLVANELQFTYDEVIGNHSHFKKVTTLYCVEGWHVTILWEGVQVKDLLEAAGVDSAAQVVIFHACDNYTTALPLDYIIENDLLMAFKMNGLVLTPARGFPFQLVAESKYGYKWIKWITTLEVSDDVDYLGYWESRGFSNDADLNEYPYPE